MKKTLKKLAGYVLVAAMVSGMGIPNVAHAEDFTSSEIVKPEVSKENFHVYLCIGQSNMAGRAGFEEEDLQVLDRTYLLTEDGEWEKAKPVYNEETGKYDGLNRNSTVKDDAKYQGLNPAFYFAKTLAEELDDDVSIGIVGNARGDTSITKWVPGDTTLTFGDGSTNLYKEALAQAKKAVEAGGTIKGILWHQGCANAGTTGYTSRFKSMVESFRTDLGIADLPVFMGEIPGFGAYKNNSYQHVRRQGFNNDFIKGTAAAVDNCYYISSIGLSDGGDETHFNSFSQREMGKRYAEIVLDKVYGKADKIDEKLSIKSINASYGENAARVIDMNADIHNYVYDANEADKYYFDESVMSEITAVPAEYVIDLGTKAKITQLDTYFSDPYRYIYQYRVYTSNDNLEWTIKADNSAATYYKDVAYDGAVTDVFDADARFVKVQITGVVDYHGEEAVPGDVFLGVNEIVLRGTGGLVIKKPLYERNFEGLEAGAYTTEGKDSYTRASSTGTATVVTENGNNYLKIAKTEVSGKDSMNFNFASYVSGIDTYTVKFSYMAATDTDMSYKMNVGSKESFGACLLSTNVDGHIQYYDGTEKTTTILSQAGIWNDYTMVIRTKTQTYDLYINDILIGKNLDVTAGSGVTLDILRFWMPSNTRVGEFNIDNVAVYEGEPEKKVNVLTNVDGVSVDATYPAGKMSITVAPTAPATESAYVVIVAEYSTDGRLINIRVLPMEKDMFKATENMTVVEGSFVSIMVWDSLSGINPLEDVVNMRHK